MDATRGARRDGTRLTCLNINMDAPAMVEWRGGVQYCEIWFFIPNAEKGLDVDYYDACKEGACNFKP
jgi:hypothetical protein